MFKRRTETINRFIETASAYLNYQAGPMMRTVFGERVGYNNQPWAGAFVDVVAREAGLRLPSCTYTPTALAVLIRDGRQRMRPKPGDLAFFNFPSENAGTAFAMPHVGIVTDVREFAKTGRFLTIEGNTRSTNPKLNPGIDGVFNRVRHERDVVAFIRPRTGKPARTLQLLTKLLNSLGLAARVDTTKLEEAARANIQVVPAALAPRLRNKQIEAVQLALSVTVGLKECNRGQWDAQTEAAFISFQRLIGLNGPQADGIPTVPVLQRLASETGLFQVSA